MAYVASSNSGKYPETTNPYGTYNNPDPSTPNTLATKDTSSTSGNTSAGDWAQWLSFINNVSNSRKKPKFVQPPWAPGQQELFDYAMNRVKGLPDTGGALAKYAVTRSTENNPIDIAAMKRGDVGYTPTGGANKADLASIIAAMGGNSGGTTPTTGGTKPIGNDPGSGPTGVAGDPFGHVTSPAGTQGDPFHGMDTTASGNTDLSSLFHRGIEYINQQHASGRNVGMTVGAIAAYLGVPSLIATGIGRGLAALWDRYMKGDQSAAQVKIPEIPLRKITKEQWDAGMPNPNDYDANGKINQGEPAVWNITDSPDPWAQPGWTDFRGGGTQLGNPGVGPGGGTPYDDTMRSPLPGAPRYGGGGRGGAN